MKAETFVGRTMAEALAKVKRRFGSDALILSTRALTRGRVLGVGGHATVEIRAARQMEDLPPLLRKKVDTASPPRASAASMSTKTLLETYQCLVQAQVGDHLAERLIDKVRRSLPASALSDASAVRTQLARFVEETVPTAGPIRLSGAPGPTLIALVGPSGVGKTTTAAKLAANFSLQAKRRVGLITLDTQRIAGVEQLSTYARIIGVPLEVADSAERLEAAVARMADRELILIDTPGRSQRDAAKLLELQALLGVVKPHEVHLVLSSTRSEPVMRETLERFGAIGVDRVIFTKMDEAVGFGAILSCLATAQFRLSYLTMGQGVPDDLEVGEGSTLTRLILGPPACVAAQ